MKDSARSMDVLKKIIDEAKEKTKVQVPAESMVENFLTPKEQVFKKVSKRQPGRPKVEDEKKAKNFTLCLAPKYLSFIDAFQVKDKKVQGRGRKIRFIIDQFVEMSRRQKTQLQILSEALKNVESVLKNFSSQVKKGEKLHLSNREKSEISKVVGQVQILVRIIGMTSKELHRILPKHEWAIMSFCLDWARKEMK
ncbi:MAG: hypothetical protein AB7I27_19530 [Bacteriovoracaceae bacterium]